MIHSEYEDINQQIGSGGGLEESRGGGRIVLISANFSLNGRIDANGGPGNSTKEDDISKDYIYA